MYLTPETTYRPDEMILDDYQRDLWADTIMRSIHAIY